MSSPLVEKSAEKSAQPYAFKERGLYNASAFFVSFGKMSFGSNNGVGVQHTVGFQFNRIFGAGLGLSYENLYLRGDNEGRTLSLFGEARGYLSKHNTAFYYSFASGLSFPIVKNSENLTGHKGGFMVYPAIGLRFGGSSRFNFFVDIGAKIQRVSYERILEFQQDRFEVTYRRWVLRGGILF